MHLFAQVPQLFGKTREEVKATLKNYMRAKVRRGKRMLLSLRQSGAQCGTPDVSRIVPPVIWLASLLWLLQIPRRRLIHRRRDSRYMGVGSSNRKNQWQARILYHGKVTHLGELMNPAAPAAWPPDNIARFGLPVVLK
jgi:hypothetical protein